MKFLKFPTLILFGSLFLLSACNNSSGGGNNGNQAQKVHYVNWESISSEFNPSTQDFAFNFEGMEKLNIDAFAFEKDVEIIYSPDFAPGTGSMKLFKVWKESASFGSFYTELKDKTLNVKSQGTYQCSINIQNGQITALKGGCYVRLQIFLPAGAEVEVYNVGTLISKRFIPMDVETFLEQLDDATWTDEKNAVIETYINSYIGMSKQPSLTSDQLGKVVDEYMRGDEQFYALRRLHTYVSDRANLAAMIEREFGYFDREEARKIVGL